MGEVGVMWLEEEVRQEELLVMQRWSPPQGLICCFSYGSKSLERFGVVPS